MKKIVALGNSIVGVKALEIIRANDQESELTIVSFDGEYPYRRALSAEFLSKEASSNQALYKPKDFYAANKINVITEQLISRVNVKRNKIFTEEKVQIDFDVLIIGEGHEPAFPDIRGLQKDGVFAFKRLSELKQIERKIPLIEHVVIQSNTFQGFKTAAALIKKTKDVSLIVDDTHVLAQIFEAPAAEQVLKYWEEKGLRIFVNNSIQEILGDVECKAVRLKNNKVIAADLVIFDEMNDDLRIFNESDLQIGEKIKVNEVFKTNLDHVYAADKIFQVGDKKCSVEDFSTEELEYQGQVIASAILGLPVNPASDVTVRTLKAPDFSLILLGNFTDLSTSQSFSSFDPQAMKYKRIFTAEGKLKAAVLLNSELEKDNLQKIIQDGVNILGQEQALVGVSLPEAQPTLS